jgi:diketogulonate reductase-like aldo/keto reductase
VDEDAKKVLASHEGASEAQVLLSWGIQRGVAVIPKSANEERMKKNLQVKLFGRFSSRTWVK